MTCSIPDCEKRVAARGWCDAHYTRWRRHGDVQYLTPVGHRYFDPNANLPNPWSKAAPPCPWCRERALKWADDGSLRWFCPPCRWRFDTAEESAA